MSAERDENACWTKVENSECEITEVKVKEEESFDDRSLCEKTNFQSGGSKRKRSKAPPGKPPYSYVALISLAITSSRRQKMTLAEIHRFIADNFPYYRTCPLKWRNAIRHNLTLNDCFVKLPRDSTHDQNRGHYWTVDPASEMMFEDGSYRRRKRRFTRREHLDEILPLLVERTNIPSYPDETPQVVHALPYPPGFPVITHVSAANQRRGFSIDDILAPRSVPVVPTILSYPPASPQIQIVDRRYQSNPMLSHPEFYWSSAVPTTYAGFPPRTFGYTTQ